MGLQVKTVFKLVPVTLVNWTQTWFRPNERGLTKTSRVTAVKLFSGVGGRRILEATECFSPHTELLSLFLLEIFSVVVVANGDISLSLAAQ